MKRPYVICHMMASIDGRIDCDMTEQVGGNEYYEALEMLCFDTTIEGKTTAVNHYAEKEGFVPKDQTAVGKEEFYRSHVAQKWEAVVDTYGTLCWPENDTPNRICIVIICVRGAFPTSLQAQTRLISAAPSPSCNVSSGARESVW
jgi:hypothetical protein